MKINDSYLCCPECKNNLVKSKTEFTCKKCNKHFKIKNEIPFFIDYFINTENNPLDGYFSKSKNKLIRWASLLSPPKTTYRPIKKFKFGEVPRPLLSSLKKSSLVLNIGSSSKKKYPNTLNLDIGPFKNVDIIADGKKLPFKKNIFDLVIIESVLEHIDEPEKVIREAYRVLNKKGRIYILIPFAFAFHGSPNDFNRYTLEGLKRRLELAGFKILSAGWESGPSSTINQFLRYYFAILFSFNNNFLFSVLLNIFGWLTFPLKYLDILLKNNKKAHIIANAVYAIGEK